MQSTILTVAGSDPTGGAGLQADIKTMSAIGVYAAAAVTCITVQNSFGVTRIEPVAPDLVSEQIQAVLEDHQVTHIKIGMVGTAAVAEAIRRSLDGFTGEIIIDPVLLSTTGQELIRPEDLATVKTGLLNLATVITPNLPELVSLTGMSADTPEETLNAGDRLLNEYPKLRAAVIKGGHGAESREVTDILLLRSMGSVKLLSSTRAIVSTRNTHGTGCVLASAYAAYHCLSRDDETAFFSSANFIQQLLEKSSRVEIVKNPEGCGGLLFDPMAGD